jgi:hypothetical protein
MYVRLAGGLIAVLGLPIFIWLTYPGHSWIARAVGAVVVAGGVGLVLGQRWAWPILLPSAIPMLGLAWFFAVASGETTHPGSEHPGVWPVLAVISMLFLIMGCLLVVASMTRATRNWLMRRSP